MIGENGFGREYCGNLGEKSKMNDRTTALIVNSVREHILHRSYLQ